MSFAPPQLIKSVFPAVTGNNVSYNQTQLTKATAGMGIEIYAHLNNTTIGICQISRATVFPRRVHAWS